MALFHFRSILEKRGGKSNSPTQLAMLILQWKRTLRIVVTPQPSLPNSCKKNIKQSELFTTLSWHPRHNQNLTILCNKNQANEKHLYLQLPYKLCFAISLSVICFRKNMVPKCCTIRSLPSVKDCEDTFSMSLGKAVAKQAP